MSLPKNVIAVSFVSCLNDLASDMVIPLLPILMATTLAAGPLALGMMEGVADAVASFLKLWSGRHSDVLGGRRKMLAVLGYALSNCARPLLALAPTWQVLVTLRSVDRIGKGIRSAPRDALIVDSTPAHMRGAAFGFHRALDNVGAVGGSLVAAAALVWWNVSLVQVILWSALPGVLAVLLFAIAVRETEQPAVNTTPTTLAPLRWAALSLHTRRYLIVLALFTFARVSETFLVLRGHELGLGTVHLLILWAALNLAKALTSAWGGALADRAGRRAVMLASWIAYAICFFLLCSVASAPSFWGVVLAYGLFAGLSEGAERAIVGDLSVPQERGTAFGWYNMVLGLAAIPAGLAIGGIWQIYGAASAFFWAGAVALVAVILFRAWVGKFVTVSAQEG